MAEYGGLPVSKGGFCGPRADPERTQRPDRIGVCDIITHGAGLAILNPAYMRYLAKDRPERLAPFATRIFGLPAAGRDALALGLEGIDAYEAFLKFIGCPTRLSQVGIGADLLEQYAEDAVLVVRDGAGNLPGRPALSRAQIVEVLKRAL